MGYNALNISTTPDRAGNVLLTRGESIAYFGPAGGALPVPGGAAVLDCAGAAIEPGRVNAHTHLYSGLVPLGMPSPEPPPRTFLEILERIWWRLDRALDERSLRASARYYTARALLAGTTTVIDHHESPSLVEGSLDALADACGETGIRAILTYGATERNGGAEEARRGLGECRRFLQSRSRVRGMVGLHASFTVSDGTIREAGRLCRDMDTVLHVHVAEDGADVEDARRRGYAGPLERLLELDGLPAGSVLAHGVHLDREQVRRAGDLGMWFVQNPRSNRGNGVGYPASLAAAHKVALGTDGYPADMEAEAEALREESGARGEDPALASRRTEAAWVLLAERFGIAFAPLAPGGAADVVVRALEGVRHVLVAGEVRVRDGELVGVSLADLEAEARAEAARLWERMGGR